MSIEEELINLAHVDVSFYDKSKLKNNPFIN